MIVVRRRWLIAVFVLSPFSNALLPLVGEAAPQAFTTSPDDAGAAYYAPTRINIEGLQPYSTNHQMCTKSLSFLLSKYPEVKTGQWTVLGYSHAVAKLRPCGGEGKWRPIPPQYARVWTVDVDCRTGEVNGKPIAGADYSGADWGNRELWAEVCRNWRD